LGRSLIVNSSCRTKWIVGLSIVLFCSQVWGEEGWSLSKLNPFRSRHPEPNVKTRISDQPQAGMKGISTPKVPRFDNVSQSSPIQVPPAPESSSRWSKPRQPSAWTRFTRGTKSMWHKTKEAMTPPWTKKNATPRTSSTPAHLGSRTPRINQQERERKSLFSSFFKPDESEPEQPRTVTGFLKQERPSY
jgi:hypothetical protein